MPETVNDSVTQMLNDAAKVTGCVSYALAEIARRLEQKLPGLITEMNTRAGFSTPDTKIRTPSWYAGAPVVEEGKKLNGILIAASDTKTVLAPRHFKSEYELAIYSIDETVQTKEQYWRHYDRAAAIQIALYQFLTGCVNERDQRVWTKLIPSGSGWMPDEWEDYGGILLNYRLTTDPSLTSGKVEKLEEGQIERELNERNLATIGAQEQAQFADKAKPMTIAPVHQTSPAAVVTESAKPESVPLTTKGRKAPARTATKSATKTARK